jgi:hypothetical protein
MILLEEGSGAGEVFPDDSVGTQLAWVMACVGAKDNECRRCYPGKRCDVSGDVLCSWLGRGVSGKVGVTHAWRV